MLYEEEHERLIGPHQWEHNPAHEWLPEQWQFLEVEIVLKRHPDWMPGMSPRFRNGRDIAQFMAEITRGLEDSDRERVFAIYISQKNEPVGIMPLFVGSATESLIHPREVFRGLLATGAIGFVLVHNHPSGDVEPSTADQQIAKRMKEASTLLGVRMLDFVVVGVRGAMYSFVDHGLLN